MTPESAPQPLVLRREAFGGILFDPLDGTYLELDPEGFEVVRGWLVDGRAPATPEEQSFVESVHREMPTLAAGSRRVRARIEVEAMAPTQHATVLASPTLVDLQVTNRCTVGCPQCYASSVPDGEHMAFEDAARILHELAAAGVCQIAIGGGEPLLHPQIVEIIELAYDLGIVPNVTTTGLALTPRVLETMARCCGAVALSLEDVGEGFAKRRKTGAGFFEASLEKLRAHKIRTVFQVTLSAENLPRLPAIVDYCLAVPDLYGVIFLAYKAVGRGDGYDTQLSAVHPGELYPWLREAFLRLSGHTKVGYDCCITPGIAGIDVELGFTDLDLLEGCSAARTSVGISANLEVVPCTFTTHLPLGNLAQRSFMDVWHGSPSTGFRTALDTQGDARTETCSPCRLRNSCLGGCPVWDLVRCTTRPPELDG